MKQTSLSFPCPKLSRWPWAMTPYGGVAAQHPPQGLVVKIYELNLWTYHERRIDPWPTQMTVKQLGSGFSSQELHHHIAKRTHFDAFFSAYVPPKQPPVGSMFWRILILPLWCFSCSPNLKRGIGMTNILNDSKQYFQVGFNALWEIFIKIQIHHFPW